MISFKFRDWGRLVYPYFLALGIGLFFPTVRKPVAAINRWVADAIDPQPLLLHTPAPTCTLQVVTTGWCGRISRSGRL